MQFFKYWKPAYLGEYNEDTTFCATENELHSTLKQKLFFFTVSRVMQRLIMLPFVPPGSVLVGRVPAG